MMSTTGGGAQDQEHRVLRQAVFHAYRDLVTVRDWRWYHTTEHVDLSVRDSLTRHVLPWGTQSVDAFHIGNPGITAEYVSPTEWERVMASPNAKLVRLIWTVKPSTFMADRFEVLMWNGALYDTTAVMTYRRRPRDLRLTGWEPASRSGLADWNNSNLTGVGTDFDAFMVGSVLRASGSQAYHPEGLAGMHPYKAEGLILSVASPTSMVVYSPAAPPIAMASTKYIVTDYLDISPGMYTSLLSACEVWVARLLGKNVEGATGAYGRDLRLAFEGDAMAALSGRTDSRAGYYAFWYLRPGADGGDPDNPDNGCPVPADAEGGGAGSDPSTNLDGGGAGTVFGDC